MRYFLRLFKSITLISCAALPILRYRLVEEEQQPTRLLQHHSQSLSSQGITDPISLAVTNEDNSKESEGQAQEQKKQAKETQQQSSQSQPQQQQNAQKQAETQKSHIQQTKNESNNNSQIPPQEKQVSQKPSQKQTELTQQEQNKPITIKIQDLQPNSVIVNAQCPSHILKYLENLGLSIIKSIDTAQQVTLKTKQSEIYRINLQDLRKNNEDELKIISNFINSPQEITTIQQARDYLKLSEKDSFTIMSYIPPHQTYKESIKKQTKSEFDTFTKSRAVDIVSLQQKFKSLAHNSSSNKNNFIIVRTPEVANFLKLDTFKIGQPYLLHETSKESGNESNCKLQGKKYNLTSIVHKWNPSLTFDLQIINKQTHFYINKIQTESQLYNKVRQMQMAGDNRKILLFFSQQSRQEFHTTNQKILEEVSRLQRQKVVIIQTANQQAIRNIFKVQPDYFATIRLIDLFSHQQPLFAQQKQNEQKVFRRQRLRGPFKVQNLCDFVSSQQWIQHYQTKRNLTQIQPISAQQLQNADNCLVLMQKAGCSGCQYVQESLGSLNNIIRIIKQDKGRAKKNLVYKYRIEDPKSLASIDLRRYSIYNQSVSFYPPRVTPKLYFYLNGGHKDLKVEQSLANLNNAHQIGEQAAHDAVLRDIINKIRLTSKDL